MKIKHLTSRSSCIKSLEYIALFIAIIAFMMVVLYSFDFFSDKKKDHFYSNPPSHSSIKFNSDVYEKGGNILKEHELGASNLCIYKYDTQNAVEDMECISLGELGIARNLPKSRRDRVCIDEECLEEKDLKLLNGVYPFRISHNKRGDRHKSLEKCLAFGYTKAQTCNTDATEIKDDNIDGIPTLLLNECNDITEVKDRGTFYLNKSKLDAETINSMLDEEPTFGQPTAGTDINLISPVHNE